MTEIFDRVYEAADCSEVARRYLEPARVPGRFVCPACGKPNITAKRTTWGCWSCGSHAVGADAVGLVSVAEGVARTDAAAILAADLGISTEVASRKRAGNGQETVRKQDWKQSVKPSANEPYEVQSWVDSLARACRVAHERLMSQECEASQRAWDYLTGPKRNLAPETIAARELGLNLDWVEFHDPLAGSDRPCKLPPGIVIPWHAGPLGISGANVRKFHVELKDKYLMATGSRRRWMYPSLPAWDGPILIVEGEFDAMVADQELSGLLPVATLGGAQCKPEDTRDSVKLGGFSRLLIAADSDEAGRECRVMWKAFSPRRSVSVDLPEGKDLSEAVAAGVNLRDWIMGVCAELGIDLYQLPGLIWESPLGTVRGRSVGESDEESSLPDEN